MDTISFLEIHYVLDVEELMTTEEDLEGILKVKREPSASDAWNDK